MSEQTLAQTQVLVVSTGTANTASVMASIRRLGARPRLTRDPLEVESASHLVLPGVGAFSAALDEIDALGLREPLRRRVLANRATLAICLGLHLLCESSQEGPGRPGLGLVDSAVLRFQGGLRIPHLGWNRVEPTGGQWIEPGEAYFANSYRLDGIPSGWSCALTNYGGAFVSAVQRGKVLGCQFHPELSGAWGAKLIERWLLSGMEAN
ncbi:MAG: glutamine amidotransferase [Planctomycetota bacterium]|jgi:glutamine amidotransferase